MARQSGSNIKDAFENDKEVFKALTIHFVQKKIDYDYSIN